MHRTRPVISSSKSAVNTSDEVSCVSRSSRISSICRLSSTRRTSSTMASSGRKTCSGNRDAVVGDLDSAGASASDRNFQNLVDLQALVDAQTLQHHGLLGPQNLLG